jgi:two-component system, chemotaxis family, chemotaxis protein CheY
MKKILIVDDTTFMRTILKTILLEEGYEVIEAADGYQCIFEYANSNPDLVLLDILMPKMDGIMALKALISYDLNAKVIMISAVHSNKMINIASHQGAKSYVIKPFQRPVLLREIKRVLEE